MKNIPCRLLVVCGVLLLSACAISSPDPAASEESVLGELPARYQGKLPCADCSGIRYELSLYRDHVYAMERTYLGTPDQYSRHFELGRWAIEDEPRKLVLTPSDGDRTTQWHVAGTQTLEALTRDGRPIESDLNYALQRTGEPVAPPIEDTYWKLIRLRGEKVGETAFGREPHIVLHDDQSRVSGAGGCNRLLGQYRHTDGALRFIKLASTSMACPGASMEIEQAFTRALGNVRSYRIVADHLVLYDADHKQLAVFGARAMQ